ncbi:MAG: HAD family hydrolase [Selenomonadaceae bacterium]|nr:HAD family hydrolase [Selenomonadaceae bacterium]
MKKIIFIDVDGTLVSYENILPDSAVYAIREARKNGHKVYICTGRSRAEVYQNIWDIGLDGMIGGNGAYVESEGKVIMHQLITLEQCKKIVDWLKNRKLEFYLESNNGLFASENFEVRGQDTIKEYCTRKNKPDAENMTVRKIFPEMIFGEKNFYRDDLNKISYIIESYEDYQQALKDFPEMKVGTWGGAGDTALFGDFGVKNIDKSKGIECLLEYLNADKKDTIAFGDSKYDLSMFKSCEIGVAVGNGSEDIKAAADFVTDSVEDDGLKNAFVKLNLI